MCPVVVWIAFKGVSNGFVFSEDFWGLRRATPRLLTAPRTLPVSCLRLPPTAVKRHRGRSALGVEHPRSAVVARNLALVRGAGRCFDRIVSGFRRQDAATGEPGVNGWEEDMWHAIGGSRGSSITDTVDGDRRGFTNERAERSFRLMPGRFPVSSMLPRASGETVMKNNNGGGRKKRAGGKKKSDEVGPSRTKRV